MKPLIYVAIDIAGGEVVRLTRGEPETKTVYGDDPVSTAIEWKRRGAQWLHVVDLDGAIKGDPQNSKEIEKVIESVKIPVQVSGGIRSIEALDRWLGLGAARVVIGTKALDREFLSRALAQFADRIVAAVDSKGGFVRLAGWRERSSKRAGELALQLAEEGIQRLIFTDIDRDGTLSGPNYEAIEKLLGTVDVPVIVSGGVKSVAHVRRLARLGPRGLEGVIIGKALYSGSLTLQAAMNAIDEEQDDV